MNIEKLFFELIQVAIGTRTELSVKPTSREWASLFEMAKKQALMGVCFVAIQRLGNDNDDDTLRYDDYRPDGSINHKPYTINLPEALRLRWLGMAAKIQQRNKVVTEDCVRLVKQLAHDGFHSCILKGQSNLEYYPEDLREARTPGDIDVLLRSMEEPVALDIPIRYCQEQARVHGAKPPHVTYHHADLAWVGTTEVEAHYRATFLCSPLRNWRLQRWLEENMPFGVCDAKIGDCTFPVPTVSYNAVYQLLHIYKHLFEGGVGLRQLLDYYFVLRALHIEQGSFADRTQSMAQWAEGMGVTVPSNMAIMHSLKRFGLNKFAGAVMYVLAHVFEPNDDDNPSLREPQGKLCLGQALNDNWASRWPWMICEPNEKEGEFLLQEILRAGNFGRYDERIKKTKTQGGHAWEKLKHNMRLVRHYPEEVIWEPVFRICHFFWRKLCLWKW